MKTISVVLLSVLCLSACKYSTQTRYNYAEVGQVQVVEFGSVVAIRDIDIVSETSDVGFLLGGTAGAAGGVYASNGVTTTIAAGVAGAVVGSALGSALEQAIRDRGGVEYTVVLRNGKTITVAQNVSEKDVIFNVGDRVMVQINGKYQRVLPAQDLPTEIEKPKGIEFK